MSEKEELRGAPAAIGMVVLVIMFGGVIFAIYPGWDAIGNFLVINLQLTSEAPAWIQAIGSMLAIVAVLLVFVLQQRAERLRHRATASALLSSYIGALYTIPQLLPVDGSRSVWTIIRVRVLLESEHKRADAVAIHALSLDEQRGVFNCRMAALQVIEALTLTEKALDESPELDGVLVHKDAYAFLQEVIKDAALTTSRGRELLGDWVKN